MTEPQKELKITQKPMGLTPDTIAAKMFSMHNTAHFLHLQTTGYAQHKMLDEVYTSLETLKDSICEFLLGAQAPRRFSSLTLDPIPSYSEGAVTRFLDQGFAFSVQLCGYAESNNLEELCNLSSELQNTFVKGKYMNTLK